MSVISVQWGLTGMMARKVVTWYRSWVDFASSECGWNLHSIMEEGTKMPQHIVYSFLSQAWCVSDITGMLTCFLLTCSLTKLGINDCEMPLLLPHKKHYWLHCSYFNSVKQYCVLHICCYFLNYNSKMWYIVLSVILLICLIVIHGYLKLL